MILLSMECDNFYMFRNFRLDFTYARKVNYDISRFDSLFDGSHIRVRKNIIVMGGNSSGKTTLGKMLCLIYNYLICRDNESSAGLKKCIYNHFKPAKFCVEFVIGTNAYRLTAEFDGEGLVHEKLSEAPVLKSYNIQALRNKLTKTKRAREYNRDKQPDGFNIGFQSYVLRIKKDDNIVEKWKKNISFWFALSRYLRNPLGNTSGAEIDIPLISKILPVIDNSVKAVIPLAPSTPSRKSQAKKQLNEAKEDTGLRKSYSIIFKNQDVLTIPDGDLSRMGAERLSQGTIEAISFSSILSFLRSGKDNMVYVDECLAHMHSELEKYIIWLSFHMKSPGSQLIFTTHNVEVCDLNLPSHSFLFLKRTKDGFNEPIWANSRFTKNDRNFKNYYENDYYGVLPDYSNLISIVPEEGE